MTNGSSPPRRSWPGVALTILGATAMTAAGALVAVFVVALVFWQFLANVVMVIFVQEWRWYGPGIYDSGGDLWWYVGGTVAIAAPVLAVGLTLVTRSGGSPRRPWA